MESQEGEVEEEIDDEGGESSAVPPPVQKESSVPPPAQPSYVPPFRSAPTCPSPSFPTAKLKHSSDIVTSRSPHPDTLHTPILTPYDPDVRMDVYTTRSLLQMLDAWKRHRRAQPTDVHPYLGGVLLELKARRILDAKTFWMRRHSGCEDILDAKTHTGCEDVYFHSTRSFLLSFQGLRHIVGIW